MPSNLQVKAFKSRFKGNDPEIIISDDNIIYEKYILGKSTELKTSGMLCDRSTEIDLKLRVSSYFHVRWFTEQKYNKIKQIVADKVNSTFPNDVARWAYVNGKGKRAQTDSLYFEFNTKREVTDPVVQKIFRLLGNLKVSKQRLMFQLGEKDRYRGDTENNSFSCLKSQSYISSNACLQTRQDEFSQPSDQIMFGACNSMAMCLMNNNVVDDNMISPVGMNLSVQPVHAEEDFPTQNSSESEGMQSCQTNSYYDENTSSTFFVDPIPLVSNCQAIQKHTKAFKGKFTESKVHIPESAIIFERYMLGKFTEIKTSEQLGDKCEEIEMKIRVSSYFYVRWFMEQNAINFHETVVRLIISNFPREIKGWAQADSQNTGGLYFDFGVKRPVTDATVQRIFRVLENFNKSQERQRRCLLYQLGEKDKYRNNLILNQHYAPVEEERRLVFLSNQKSESNECVDEMPDLDDHTVPFFNTETANFLLGSSKEDVCEEDDLLESLEFKKLISPSLK